MKTSSALLISAVSAGVLAQNYETYPSVAHTASINGFADPIYGQLPECAKECVELDTGNTPCPYWDPGCLCYMPQWSGEVGSCFAEKCSGDDVKKATSLAYGICDKVGASKWEMPSSVSQALSSAAEAEATATSSAEADSSSAAPASSAQSSAAAQSTSSAKTTEQTSAVDSSTPAVTSSSQITSSVNEVSSSSAESASSSAALTSSANSTLIEQVNGGVGPASYGIIALGAVAGAIVLA